MRKGPLPVIPALLLLLAACSSETIDNTALTDPDPDSNPDPIVVSYAQDVQSIFTQSCGGSGCHIDSATNGVRLVSHAAVLGSVGVQYGSAVVIPGNAAGSPLVDKISAGPRFGSRMPLGRGPLSGQQITTIRNWIDDGALDN